jgi:shikimate kinase
MERARNERPIALIGLMGAGKTTVARVLGERLGASVADLDAMIEAEEGRPIAELFAHAGEAWFRQRERELLDRVLVDGVAVVACGGGIVTEPTARRSLHDRCRVVWLEVSPEAAARRVEATAASRPMLAGDTPARRLESLAIERTPFYSETAHVRVATDGRTPEAVADAVLAALEAPR